MAQDMTGAAAAVNAVKEKQGPQSPVEGVLPQEPQQAKPDPKVDEWARKEQQLRKMQRDLEERERKIKEQESKYSSEYVPKSELDKYVPKNRFEDDPLGTLAEMGLDNEKLTQLLLSGHNSQDPTIRALRQEIRSIKEQQEQSRKAAEQATQQQYDQVIKQINHEVSQLVQSSQDFEMIKNSGMEEAVSELIQQTWNSTGTLMDIDEAARQVEEHLVEEAFKLAQLSKVQQRLKPKAPESAPISPQQPQQGMKTLTNAVTQDQPTTPRLTDKQRRERAIAAFMGKLNQ